MAGCAYCNPGWEAAVVQLSPDGDILGESGVMNSGSRDLGYAMAVQQSDGSFIVVGCQMDNVSRKWDILLARFAFQVTES
jgi:hypothetical protein